MKIDLFKLNNMNYVDVDDIVTFDPAMFDGTDIREIKDCHVVGRIEIGYQDDISCDLEVNGTFILPCAISLEDVSYDFSTKIEENLGNFNDFYDKKKNSLDILPFIWENIVSEVPIRVVKEGVNPQNIVGDGWELVCDE